MQWTTPFQCEASDVRNEECRNDATFEAFVTVAAIGRISVLYLCDDHYAREIAATLIGTSSGYEWQRISADM
jgi:hypothetical protein